MNARLTLRQFSFGPLIVVFLLILSACGEGDTVAASFKDDIRAPGEPQLVYEVTGVDVTVMESLPLQLRINAQGRTRTGGWSAPALVLDDDASGAGLLVFNLVAIRPTGMATQMITPIAAVTDYGPWTDRMVREIRVVAETNNESYFFPGEGSGNSEE